MEKPMTKEIAQKMLQSNEESLRDLALLHYPELGDITQRIKTIEDAYKELGITRTVLKGLTKREQAFRDICVVVDALNEGWKPNFNNSSQYKYTLWWNLQGQALNCVSSYFYSVANVPAPTLLKSKALAEYAARQFKDLWLLWLNP